MPKPRTKLTPTARYLLVCLMEEAAEVSKEAAKILRFGPHDRYQKTTPERRLKGELSDLMGVWNLLTDEGLDIRATKRLVLGKEDRVEKAMAYSRAKGLL